MNYSEEFLNIFLLVEVKVVVETADFENGQQLKKKLLENYKNIKFNEASFAIHKSAAFE